MSTGRFISEDTHWNPSNMIYGDNEYKKEEIKYPDIISILQATNLYGYCIGNPIVYKDVTGEDLIMDPNLINDSIKSVWFLGAEFY